MSAKGIPADLRAICDRINEHFPSRQQKVNWQWRTHYTSRHSKTDEELTEDKIFEQQNKGLEEVRAFEAKLQEALQFTTDD